MNKLGIIAGLFWGIIGISVGIPFLGRIALGGFILSPLAGLLLVRTVPLFVKSVKPVRILISICSVFVGAAIFGLGVGIADLILGHPERIPWAVVMQGVFGVMWGVVFLNFYLVGLLFWPASYYTYIFLGRKLSI